MVCLFPGGKKAKSHHRQSIPEQDRIAGIVSGYTFSETPPTHCDATCERTAALFHSRDWQALLEQSFGCQSLYAWNAESASGAALSVFKAGPFHIAYLGFPVGGMLGNVLTDDAS